MYIYISRERERRRGKELETSDERWIDKMREKEREKKRREIERDRERKYMERREREKERERERERTWRGDRERERERVRERGRGGALKETEARRGEKNRSSVWRAGTRGQYDMFRGRQILCFWKGKALVFPNFAHARGYTCTLYQGYPLTQNYC